ncbi:hypothetical protein [Modicisalibacter tunisiensis]|uniref:HD Cas3-type domain-containing protein n=1 Tax=Modicisalibacter tunisiensis TaxID=390637 RepID=A0ABS7WZ45_9GAMM|nr:hypothetical protein [Modicisalibacter tunisiensis]MBZ9539573.1 hypothetical protein [Modicisalibacter tunisiensis]MBZ9567022.1 hypothetical protein [Modicisalibacter tunisiensis]
MTASCQADAEPAGIGTTLELASLIAGVAGRSHDLGKAGSYFVEKLQHAAAGHDTEPDPVRHEWVSMKALERMLQGIPLHEALGKLPLISLAEGPSLGDGVRSAGEGLRYICATHHRLFGPPCTSRTQALTRLDASNHVREPVPPFTYPVSADKRLTPSFTRRLEQDLRRLLAVAGESPDDEPFWYGLVWLSRVALILADQGVSADIVGAEDGAGGREAIPPNAPGLYANTWPRHAEMTGRGYNQPLEWHLSTVAEKASEVAGAMWRMSLPALEPGQVDDLLAPAQGHHVRYFGWQDEAVEAIRQHREASAAPLLVFNVASTGAGKTVMNVKAACAAASGPLRLSYALNLRTLTLQTGDALERDLGLGRESVATVIGDKVAVRLHETEQTAADPQDAALDAAGVFEDVQFEVAGGISRLPDWLAPVTERRTEWRSILASPVLVSTVDFLVQAGEPGRQGHHAAAYLRVMHSDLILDEVDSYDTESLVAILRLIQVAASLGRNVVCSSATLPQPIAHAIAEAYHSGHRVWSALCGQAQEHGVLAITDTLPPSWIQPGASFQEDYQTFLGALGGRRGPATKRACLQSVDDNRGVAGLFAAIEAGVERLHASNCWSHGDTGKSVSFGLVRVANIQTANAVAEYLQRLPDTFVCLYHARDFAIQRHSKERALDRLLNRKRGNEAIEQDPDVGALCAATEGSCVRFVVVATPVEEIGRDHDFDWAVIEPSGSHSIVQTAGRVNRHRRIAVTEPNVAVLQYNARALRKESVAFTRPGPESGRGFRKYLDAGDAYPDLGYLLDWDRLDRLTAAMAFDTAHPLVKGEQHHQQALLKEPLKVLRRDRRYESIWMGSRFYGKYPLRSKEDDGLEEWRVLPREGGGRRWERWERHGFTLAYTEQGKPRLDMHETNWLSWSIEALWEACDKAGITPEQGMTFKIRRSSGQV